MSDTELLHEPKPEPVRRLEVFTGAGRRRRWTAEEKARIVAETYAGVESVCAVARRYGLTQQQLFGWRRAARERAGDAGDGMAFAPVMVETSCPGAATRAAGPGVAAIEIEIGGATIRVPSGADVGTLLAVLCTVKAVS
jgi:transposase